VAVYRTASQAVKITGGEDLERERKGFKGATTVGKNAGGAMKGGWMAEGQAGEESQTKGCFSKKRNLPRRCTL